MSTYAPCTGTGKVATDIRVMMTAGLGSKFRHLHGKNAGHCPDCGKSATLGRGVRVMPRHKDAR